ncbi:hypothetical protein VPH35_075616 [Triticum aestivum]
MWEGEVVTPSDGRSHRLPYFPDNATYVMHGYLLHNPFSDTSVPLTTLNSTITNHQTCYIRKFLMRSTADDFIAVLTDSKDYSFIVFREGKGVWLPEPGTAPYMYIIDVAFLGDTLYAIDQDENLVPLHLTLDGDGKPVVTKGKCIIWNPLGYYDDDDDDNNGDDDNDGDGNGGDDDDDDDGVSDDDDDDDDDNDDDDDDDGGGKEEDDEEIEGKQEEEEDVIDDDGISDDDDDDDHGISDDDDNNKDDDDKEEEDEESEGKEEDEEEQYYDEKEQDYDEVCGDYVEVEKNDYDEKEEYYDEEYEKIAYGGHEGVNFFNSAEECTRDEETNEEDIITRHLIESRGKLLLVRRKRRIPSSELCRGYTRHGYTRHVEVLEADLTTGAWVPLLRLGGGCALFVSQDFSRIVPAPCGEIKEDVMYNLDTGEVFDLKSHTSTGHCCSPSGAITWLFPPKLVV